MTPQESRNLPFLNPNYIIVLDIDEISNLGLDIKAVEDSLTKGIFYTADIYIIKHKEEFMEELINASNDRQIT